MRILMLAPRFPYPPERGDTLRSWTVLSGLARRHDLWLACVDSVAPTPEHLGQVHTLCRELAVFVRSPRASLWTGLRAILAGRSLTEGYFGAPGLRETVAQWSQSQPFDALLTYSSGMAPAASAVQAQRRILDLCDVDSHKWSRYARHSTPPLRWCYDLESERVAILEARAARAHDVCLVVNERERKKLSALLPDVRVQVMPTTVEFERYRPAPPPPDPVIGMLGSMSYPPNVHAVNWFGRFVWPLVRLRTPHACWLIVGRDPARSVRRWGQLPGVEVTGHVPDAQPYLQRMRVFANPVRGDLGVQSKLLVAMASGRPAVTTSDAAAGLSYSGSAPYLVANSPCDFATAILRLICDTELWQRLSTRGRQVVESSYAPQRQLDVLEPLLAEKVSQRPRRARRREFAAR